MIKTVSLIGSGNIAHWLVYAMRKAGVTIRQIYSRLLEHASSLAEKADARAIDHIADLTIGSDLYVFSVKDDSYEDLLSQMTFRMPMAVHTAGSLSMRFFEPYAESYGILYPYQSLNKEMDFEGVEVPLCVEANDEMFGKTLFSFAKRLSSSAQMLDEAQRVVLHRAAVFGCNFTNAMYAIAYDILKEHNIDWQMIQPLLRNTLDKVKQRNPHEVQTGPAIRKDWPVIQRHIDALQDERLKEIYRLMTDYIIHNK